MFLVMLFRFTGGDKKNYIRFTSWLFQSWWSCLSPNCLKQTARATSWNPLVWRNAEFRIRFQICHAISSTQSRLVSFSGRNLRMCAYIKKFTAWFSSNKSKSIAQVKFWFQIAKKTHENFNFCLILCGPSSDFHQRHSLLFLWFFFYFLWMLLKSLSEYWKHLKRN